MATGEPKAVRTKAPQRERTMTITAAAERGTGLPTCAATGLPPEACPSKLPGDDPPLAPRW